MYYIIIYFEYYLVGYFVLIRCAVFSICCCLFDIVWVSIMCYGDVY